MEEVDVTQYLREKQRFVPVNHVKKAVLYTVWLKLVDYDPGRMNYMGLLLFY